MAEYLDIPFASNAIMHQKDARRIDLTGSIHNDHLITITSYNEVRHGRFRAGFRV